MLGLTSFLTEKERILGARSKNISHIIYLEKDDFLNIINDFPKDFVKNNIFFLKKLIYTIFFYFINII